MKVPTFMSLLYIPMAWGMAVALGVHHYVRYYMIGTAIALIPLEEYLETRQTAGNLSRDIHTLGGYFWMLFKLCPWAFVITLPSILASFAVLVVLEPVGLHYAIPAYHYYVMLGYSVIWSMIRLTIFKDSFRMCLRSMMLNTLGYALLPLKCWVGVFCSLEFRQLAVQFGAESVTFSSGYPVVDLALLFTAGMFITGRCMWIPSYTYYYVHKHCHDDMAAYRLLHKIHHKYLDPYPNDQGTENPLELALSENIFLPIPIMDVYSWIALMVFENWYIHAVGHWTEWAKAFPDTEAKHHVIHHKHFTKNHKDPKSDKENGTLWEGDLEAELANWRGFPWSAIKAAAKGIQTGKLD